MRRQLRPLALAALAAAASLTPAAAAQTPPAPAPSAPPPAATQAPVDWQLHQAGRDARSLDLWAFGSGSCLPGTLRAEVVETARRIVITVRSSSTAEVCTDDYRAHALTAQLSTPVRGRPIIGPRRLGRDPFGGAQVPRRVRVPRATGLARADALAVVRRHGLTPRVRRVADLRGLPRVVGQSPASGRTVARDADVTLFLSR